MELIKQIALYAVLLFVFWGTIVLVRAVYRYQVPSGYGDVNNLEEYTSYRVDKRYTIDTVKRGDPVCYRISKDRDHEVNFGWVAALPGDDVTIAAGDVLVNGKPLEHGSKISSIPDCGPLHIPANYFYVVNDGHQTDSTSRGPLPAIALHGRIGGNFP